MAYSSKKFGFPRWGSYGHEHETTQVRMCDYAGCTERGDHPCPKAPGSNERWYFCRPHAAEYNQGWDFFANMSAAERDKFSSDSANQSSDPFAQSRTFEWGGAIDEDGYSRTEQTAFDVLELDVGASQEAIKKQYRKLAKLYHPDANPGDPQAAQKFHEVQTAYDLLKQPSL